MDMFCLYLGSFINKGLVQDFEAYMIDPKQLVAAAKKKTNASKWNGHRIIPLTGTNNV